MVVGDEPGETTVETDTGKTTTLGDLTLTIVIYDESTPGSLGLPRDADGDALPDRWEKDNGSNPEKGDSDSNGIPDAREDADQRNGLGIAEAGPAHPPGSRTRMGVTGDGLTAWEEYRGFLVLIGDLKRNKHDRLDPRDKDLFIISDVDVPETEIEFPFTGAIGMMKRLAIKIERVDLELLKGMKAGEIDYYVNENNVGPAQSGVLKGSDGAKLQRALRLTDKSEPPGFATAKDLGNTVLRPLFIVERNIIHTAKDGLCQTTAHADDVQLIPVGQGQPFGEAFSPGDSGKIESKPGGDDRIVMTPLGPSLTTGPNGILESKKADADKLVNHQLPGTNVVEQIAYDVDPVLDGLFRRQRRRTATSPARHRLGKRR